MVCYDPIFCTELAAHIFAYQYLLLGPGPHYKEMNRNFMETVAASIEDFVRDTFGEEPEKRWDNDYRLTLEATRLDQKACGPLHQLWKKWKASINKPSQRKEARAVLVDATEVERQCRNYRKHKT